MEERRKHLRHKKSYSVTYQIVRRILRHPSNSIDISEGGIRLLTTQRLDVGSIIKVWVEIGESIKPIVAMGEVVWVNRVVRAANDYAQDSAESTYEIGIAFIEVDPDRRNELKELLKRLAAEKPSGGIQPLDD